MTINKKLLPLKAHNFLFMAAISPIQPQIAVYGKQLGISSVVMGTFIGLLPIVSFLVKPVFGILVDVYRNYRKTIFLTLIAAIVLSLCIVYFIPTRQLMHLQFANLSLASLDTCNITATNNNIDCNGQIIAVICTSECLQNPMTLLTQSTLLADDNNNYSKNYYQICTFNTRQWNDSRCDLFCKEDIEINYGCLHQTLSFWVFIIFVGISLIGYEVINAISDAICFDLIGKDGDFGRQKVWATIGYGTSALISGFFVNIFSKNADFINYTPAFILVCLFGVFDLAACVKLELPVMEPPKSIFKDLKQMLKDAKVLTFLTFTVFIGMFDMLTYYFLFWHMEELAVATKTENIKLIEGFIMAAQTFGGELLFFLMATKCLNRFGLANCFSACFLAYATRMWLIAIVSSPWWIVLIEFILNGPSFAMAYTVIAAYANELSPPGASATMQSTAAGMDKGLGYFFGSILVGIMYKWIGTKITFQIFGSVAALCAIIHVLLHKIFLQEKSSNKSGDVQSVEYKSPEEAVKTT